jgi:hypothetical protein
LSIWEPAEAISAHSSHTRCQEPDTVCRLKDPRLVWISFRACLRLSMSFWSTAGSWSRRRKSCCELQALFEEDNLLGDPRQVVVVPARDAYPEYLEYGAYVCQPRRSFKPVERMAFYCRGQIEREIPLIRHVMEEVGVLPGERGCAADLR